MSQMMAIAWGLVQRWLPVWLVPLLGLIVLQANWAGFIGWWLS